MGDIGLQSADGRFYARRTVDSTWNGKYIIDRAVIRPEPITVKPYTDRFTSETTVQLSRMKHAFQHWLAISEQIERADHMRFLA